MKALLDISEEMLGDLVEDGEDIAVAGVEQPLATGIALASIAVLALTAPAVAAAWGALHLSAAASRGISGRSRVRARTRRSA